MSGSSDKAAAESIKAFREVIARREFEQSIPARAKVKEERRIGLSFNEIYDNVVPPFNYQWTWSNMSGPGTPVVVVNAQRENGDLYMGLSTDKQDLSSSAVAAVAVGIFFRPPTQEGTFRFWSNPSVSESWNDIALFGTCSSDGWIGLYAGRYNLDGSFNGAPVNIQNQLWNDATFFIGDNYQAMSSMIW